MGEHTAISWSDSTFNPWRGCTKVSPGCTHCYADRDSNRNPKVLGVWGPRGTRVLASEDMWAKPLKWDAAAAGTGRRHLVFCASLADVFEQWAGPIVDSKGKRMAVSRLSGDMAFLGTNGDHRVGTEQWGTMDDVRLRLFQLIRDTPHLTWLLLTKRIEDAMGTLRRCADLCEGRPASGVWDVLKWLVSWINGHPPENVWLGTSVEDQEWADKRVPELLKVPAKLRWLSVEPQLGPVDLSPWLDRLRWVICGGESGGKARPFDLAWADSLREQCGAAGIPYFLKQLGARPVRDMPGVHRSYKESFGGYPWKLKHPAGADPGEWPERLRVQETPKGA